MVSTTPDSAAPFAQLSSILSPATVESAHTVNVLQNQPSRTCSCKSNSGCLKLYCDCFSAGGYCGTACSCSGCHNLLQFESQRQDAILRTLARKPNAFRLKVSQTSAASVTGTANATSGCSCKRTGCLKKYCMCFVAGLPCSENCRCENCRNSEPGKIRSKRDDTDHTEAVHQHTEYGIIDRVGEHDPSQEQHRGVAHTQESIAVDELTPSPHVKRAKLQLYAPLAMKLAPSQNTSQPNTTFRDRSMVTSSLAGQISQSIIESFGAKLYCRFREKRLRHDSSIIASIDPICDEEDSLMCYEAVDEDVTQGYSHINLAEDQEAITLGLLSDTLRSLLTKKQHENKPRRDDQTLPIGIL